ncbi:energy transducer TonB [Hydrogenophilus thiooxidans]|uniref:energy transducer TonB n=1 Tax=Hydrogenophilus thiooxidans TaxID=2820326 RepID=UPI001C228D37|nr:energy transducer TonB [Hydrogenophilus thiooxidans]
MVASEHFVCKGDNGLEDRQLRLHEQVESAKKWQRHRIWNKKMTMNWIIGIVVTAVHVAAILFMMSKTTVAIANNVEKSPKIVNVTLMSVAKHNDVEKKAEVAELNDNSLISNEKDVKIDNTSKDQVKKKERKIEKQTNKKRTEKKNVLNKMNKKIEDNVSSQNESNSESKVNGSEVNEIKKEFMVEQAENAMPIVEQPSAYASYLNNPPPDYPTASRRLGEEGTVIIRALIEEDGHASIVQVEKSSGYLRLDRAAEEAVKKWKFKPGKKNGIPVAMWHLIPIKFELK